MASLADQLAALMDPRFNTMEQLFADLESGIARAWQGPNSLVIAYLNECDTGAKVVNVRWAVGDLNEVISWCPAMEEWGRANGATAMLISGRKGWERVMRDFDFHQTILMKEL